MLKGLSRKVEVEIDLAKSTYHYGLGPAHGRVPGLVPPGCYRGNAAFSFDLVSGLSYPRGHFKFAL